MRINLNYDCLFGIFSINYWGQWAMYIPYISYSKKELDPFGYGVANPFGC